MLEKIETSQSTRRGFLGTAALTAASYKRVLGANDRVGIGFIGFGLIGKQHIYNFKTSFPDVDRVAMCDVYKPRLEEGLAYMASPNAKGYGDFRKMYENKDIDGVVVATPDHWHAMLTIMACAAGKDVYVEKPLTLFIDEGKWMIQAMNKYKRVVVAGTQRNHNPGYQTAKKIIESGLLGKLQEVRLGNGARNLYPGFGKTPVTNPPSTLDYDLWLGPAPKKPYQNHRALYHFRWFWDYSGGQLTNNHAHTIAAFLLVLGVKAPTMVTSYGGRYTLEDDGETPDVQDVICQFPGFIMTVGVRDANAYRDLAAPVVMGSKGNLILGTNQVIPEMHGDPVNAIPRFEGQPTGGPVYSDTKPVPWIEAQAGTGGRGGPGGGRGRAEGSGGAGRGRAEGAKGGGREEEIGGSGEGFTTMSMENQLFNANKRDWVNCIKSRNKPLCDLEGGHHAAVICHLGNISLRLGGPTLHWDAEKEVIVGNKEAAAMCVRPYRAPWDGVLKSIVKV